MAGAGLADIFNARILIIGASVVLLGAGVVSQFLPGIGRPAAEWRRALQLLRTAPTAPTLAAGRAAVMMDFDRLSDVLPEIGKLTMSRRNAFLQGATVSKAPPGTAIVKVGDAGNSAFFVLGGGKAVAGIPAESGNFRALSSMGAGDFFGEIAAITAAPARRTSCRRGDRAAAGPGTTLKSLLDVPAMESLINSKPSERLTRTQNADLVRLAGLDQRDMADLRRKRGAHAPVSPG